MKLLATKTVTGTHSLTGQSLKYTVEAFETDCPDITGRWIVKLNGRTIRWYAMEAPVLRCVRKARVGAYGISFGEAF